MTQNQSEGMMTEGSLDKLLAVNVHSVLLDCDIADCNEDKIAKLYNEAMVDLDLANVSQGEKEILAIKLVDIRWEEQQ